MDGSTNAKPTNMMCCWLSHASFAVEAETPQAVNFNTIPHYWSCANSLNNELISVSGSEITVKKKGMYHIHYHPLFGSWAGSGTSYAYGSNIQINDDTKTVSQITTTDIYASPVSDIDIGLNIGDKIKILVIAGAKITVFGWHTGETGMWWVPTGYLSITYLGA